MVRHGTKSLVVFPVGVYPRRVMNYKLFGKPGCQCTPLQEIIVDITQAIRHDIVVL